jgi:RimJ/RimL family protein N-acetyltransferase
MFPLVTDRLTIQPLRLTDFHALYAVYSDPEVARYIPGGVRDEEGTRCLTGSPLIGHNHHTAQRPENRSHAHGKRVVPSPWQATQAAEKLRAGTSGRVGVRDRARSTS